MDSKWMTSKQLKFGKYKKKFKFCFPKQNKVTYLKWLIEIHLLKSTYWKWLIET